MPLNELLPSFIEGLNKRQISSLAEESVSRVLEEGNAIQVAEALATMEEFVKSVRRDERFVQYLRDELSKYHGRIETSSGARIENCEAGVTYDYSYNAEWCEVDDQIKTLQEYKKNLEARLRSIASGRIGVDTETGEVIEGALKNSKSTYRVTLGR